LKVIVASDIPTTREVLGDLCDDSLLVNQGDLLSLTLSVESALNHVESKSEWCRDITQRTRERCVKEYSMGKVRRKLNKVVGSVT
jgi:hypothetical protein